MLGELHVTTTTGDANNIARVKKLSTASGRDRYSQPCLFMCVMATRLFTYSIDQKVDYGKELKAWDI